MARVSAVLRIKTEMKAEVKYKHSDLTKNNKTDTRCFLESEVLIEMLRRKTTSESRGPGK